MRTEQLSIHKCAIELATLATRILPDMNRAHRGLIGRDIRDAAKAAIKNIRYANESRDQARVDYINTVLDLTESARKRGHSIAADLTKIYRRTA
jgi:hypothetical protein